MGHSSREAEKVVATTRPEKLLLLFWCVLALLPSHPLETSSRSPPASLRGGVLTQERLNFSFQLLWCGRANGLDHWYGNYTFESPHNLCPTCENMKRCPDAAFYISPFKYWESESAKLGAWGEQGGRWTGQNFSNQSCGLLRLQEKGPLSTRSTPIRFNLFYFITLSQAAVSLPSPLICLSLSVFLTPGSFLRFRMHNLRELAQ